MTPPWYQPDTRPQYFHCTSLGACQRRRVSDVEGVSALTCARSRLAAVATAAKWAPGTKLSAATKSCPILPHPATPHRSGRCTLSTQWPPPAGDAQRSMEPQWDRLCLEVHAYVFKSASFPRRVLMQCPRA